MSIAPIVLFVYNRPWHTRQTVEALRHCELAAESDLYIFADGPKEDASDNCKKKIAEVREYIHNLNGFHSIHIEEAPANIGLANSVISGVSKVIAESGKVIVLEDDIVASTGFLRYMNDALTIYNDEPKVMHISGYMYPLKQNHLPDYFFYPAASCWGWATWDRAWQYFCPDARFLYDQITKKKLLDTLNINTIHDFEKQLLDNIDGSLNTWFIKWNASVILKKGVALYPKISYVQNIGFDNSGEHCSTTNIFYCPQLMTFVNLKKQPIVTNKKAIRYLKGFNNPNTNPSMVTMRKKINRKIRHYLHKLIIYICPEINMLSADIEWGLLKKNIDQSSIGKHVKIYPPIHLNQSYISDYSYVSMNAYISMTTIGKFCSIGPNLVCGWGIHPTNGISTSPMFYSTREQNGTTLSKVDKIEERKKITIGNDVFIGANVTILDGVTIGDGAVIGAGAVVSKDIPPYAIAVGCPIEIKRYRLPTEQIDALQKIRWWDFDEKKLKDVERYFFDVEKFIHDTSKQPL